MQNFIYSIIFLLLVWAVLLLIEVNPFKRKSYLSLSQQTLQEKIKNVDERFSKLSARERLSTAVRNTVTMSGSRLELFWVLVAASGAAGFGLGILLFRDIFLAVVTALVLLPMPYILYKIKSRWYRRNQDELLESTMSIITNSYIGCNDIIMSVNENLSKLEIRRPFAEFISDVTLIDSNIKRALRRLELKIDNIYFSEWIDVLVLAQEKSGDMRFILPSIVESMNDAKKLQVESDTVMMNVWKEYFMTITLAFSIIPILRWSNEAWFGILTSTLVGRLLIVLMLALTLLSAFIVMHINRPI